jgi:trehalose 6-phosphate phosphatase
MVPPSQAPGLPPDFDPRHAALFLDFDGTLVDIAPTPDTVQVPQGLPDLLARLAARLDGALAIVSGRTLAELDHFLPGPLAKAGEHGAALRLRPDAPVIATLLPAPPASWAARAAELAECFPGVLVEPKAHGLAIHYRLAPEAERDAGRLAHALVEERPDTYLVMPAHMAFEIKPRAVSKGTVVASLLGRAPFAGRVPVFVGDDVTDEAGMAAARAAGGFGLRMQDTFRTPEAFRAWLGTLDAALAGQAA